MFDQLKKYIHQGTAEIFTTELHFPTGFIFCSFSAVVYL